MKTGSWAMAVAFGMFALTGCAAESIEREYVGRAGSALEASDAARFSRDCSKLDGALGGGGKTCTLDMGADEEVQGKTCEQLGGKSKGPRIDQHGATMNICVIRYEADAAKDDSTEDATADEDTDVATK